MKFLLPLAAAGLAFASPVAAQEPVAQDLIQLQPADPASVTDEEIAGFVTIVMQAQGLDEDQSLTDEQRMTALFNAAVEQGMGVERFISLSMAIGDNESLQQRVQAAVIAMVPDDAEG